MVCFLEAEGGIRDLVRSRGFGDVYKRQAQLQAGHQARMAAIAAAGQTSRSVGATYSEILDISHAGYMNRSNTCLLYTSDAADERSSVDLGGRRIIKKKITQNKRLLS